MSTRRSTRASLRSKPLGEILQEGGLISPEQLTKAMRYQEQRGGLLGQILTRIGACGPADVSQALNKQFNVTDIPLGQIGLSISAAQLIGKEFCEKNKLLPFEIVDNLMCVAMANPLNRRAIAKIENDHPKYKVKTFKSPWREIKTAIDRVFTAAENMRSKQVQAVDVGEAPEAADEPVQEAEDTIAVALNAEPEVVQVNERGLMKKEVQEDDMDNLPPQGKVTVDVDWDDFNADADIEEIGRATAARAAAAAAAAEPETQVEIVNQLMLAKPITQDNFAGLKLGGAISSYEDLVLQVQTWDDAELLAHDRNDFESRKRNNQLPTGFLEVMVEEVPEAVQGNGSQDAVVVTPVPPETLQAVPVQDAEEPAEEYPSNWHTRVSGAGPLLAVFAPRGS